MNTGFYVIVSCLVAVLIGWIAYRGYRVYFGDWFFAAAGAVTCFALVFEIESVLLSPYENIIRANKSENEVEYVQVLQKKWFRVPEIREYAVHPGKTAYIKNSKLINAKKIKIDL